MRRFKPDFATRQPRAVLEAAERLRKQDNDRNKQPHRKLYHLPEWHHLRKLVLKQEPFCSCGCGQASTVVDHIEDHNGDRVLFFDRSNLRGMAKECHDRKTAKTKGWGRWQEGQ